MSLVRTRAGYSRSPQEASENNRWLAARNGFQQAQSFHGTRPCFELGSADLFFKVCGFSHQPRPRIADLENGSTLPLLQLGVRGKRVANLSFQPKIYHLFFVRVSAGVRCLPEDGNRLWPISTSHWPISGSFEPVLPPPRTPDSAFREPSLQARESQGAQAGHEKTLRSRTSPAERDGSCAVSFRSRKSHS